MTVDEPARQPEDGLRELLRTMRRPGGEAEWTQVIASVASRDPAFAGRLAAVLVEAAPRRDAADRLGPLPERMACLPETSLWAVDGRDLGRVDLRFADEDDQRFELLVELKLGASYGHEQLERYLRALDASPIPAGALIAVTAATEQVGEEAAAGDDRWLGSIRWADVFDRLRALDDHDDPLLASAWRAALDLLRDQGDFGPMDLDETAIHSWARRDKAEATLRYLLKELAQPALGHLREALGAPADDAAAAALVMRGQTGFIWPWKNQMHLKYAIPGDAGEERLRLQFLAAKGEPYFTVEARYQHPKDHVAAIPAVAAAGERLGADFEKGNDGWGHYWARVVGTDDWLQGSHTLDRLLALVRESIDRLVDSGIFAALDELTPATPATAEPPAAVDE